MFALAWRAAGHTLSSKDTGTACTQTKPGRTQRDRVSQGNHLWCKRWHGCKLPASWGCHQHVGLRKALACFTPKIIPGRDNTGRTHTGVKAAYRNNPKEVEIWSSASQWVQFLPSALTGASVLLQGQLEQTQWHEQRCKMDLDVSGNKPRCLLQSRIKKHIFQSCVCSVLTVTKASSVSHAMSPSTLH